MLPDDDQQTEQTSPESPVQSPERTPEPIVAPTEPAEPVTEPEQPKPAGDWRDREIARLRKQRDTREQELATLRAAQQNPVPTTAGPNANAEFQRLVSEEASKQASTIAAAEVFAARCNETVEAGKKAYTDFDQKVNSLKGLVDFNDQQQAVAYNTFLSAALETGQAPRLIYELGADPNEASRIMALAPIKMAVELAKMTAAEPTEVSNAPRPITPVTRTASNRSPINPDDPERADQLSTAEWMSRRTAQEAARRQSRFGR